ncbi:hypothetical protein LWI29_034897 [Acer saccharum]|uniref:Photosystem II 10 kDa polypeptide, chloroplastic n=1 Tax=Acer saccharum TaxID=4024 RepID=A0AA39SLA1_ACESA|nr:hypothetical protein LWI29_034897 [Acer saccharum]
MAASVMASSLSLRPAPFAVEKSSTVSVKGLPSLYKTCFKVVASGGKKIKTSTPLWNQRTGPRNGVYAYGRKPRGKGAYQFVDKYGANVDGYSTIYNKDDWSPSGDVYVGATTGLAIWA